MRDQLDAIAQSAPEEVSGPISVDGEAILAAAKAPGGFSRGSATTKSFDQALKSMAKACVKSSQQP